MFWKKARNNVVHGKWLTSDVTLVIFTLSRVPWKSICTDIISKLLSEKGVSGWHLQHRIRMKPPEQLTHISVGFVASGNHHNSEKNSLWVLIPGYGIFFVVYDDSSVNDRKCIWPVQNRKCRRCCFFTCIKKSDAQSSFSTINFLWIHRVWWQKIAVKMIQSKDLFC